MAEIDSQKMLKIKFDSLQWQNKTITDENENLKKECFQLNQNLKDKSSENEFLKSQNLKFQEEYMLLMSK